MFERYYRVQMNTLELLVVLLPALPLFSFYVSARWGAVLGLIYLAGRFVYSVAYLKDPGKRSVGYALSFLPVAVLLIGGIAGATLAAFRG
jgi:glutathione S-transferase